MSEPGATSIRRFGWYACRFTGMDGGPVYVDLLEVAAVTEAKGGDGALIPGARIVMKGGGVCLYAAETADAVWSEVHRAHTSNPPPEPKNKMGDAAPAADILMPSIGGRSDFDGHR